MSGAPNSALTTAAPWQPRRNASAARAASTPPTTYAGTGLDPARRANAAGSVRGFSLVGEGNGLDRPT
jgi:hypothetical protein